MAERYYTADEAKALLDAGSLWYPCNPGEDPAEALAAWVARMPDPDAISRVLLEHLGDDARANHEAERMRRVGVDPDRVIDGEVARKEMAAGQAPGGRMQSLRDAAGFGVPTREVEG